MGRVASIILKSFIGVVSHLLGAVAAWASVYAAFLLYMLTPLFFIVPPEPRRHDVSHSISREGEGK